MRAPPERDEWMESLLKQPMPYIDDDGFTAQVVERLPPKRSSKQRLVVIGASALLAGLAALVLPIGDLVPEALRSVMHLPGKGEALPIVGWMLLALLAWAAVGLARAEDA